MSVYKTVPNQKIVKINKAENLEGKKFMLAEMESLEAAARNLKAGAFKLWVYFVKQRNGFEFALSSSAVNECFGISKKQYDGAIKELLDKGYLICNYGNHYEFRERADTKSNNENTNQYVVTKSNNEFNEDTVVTKSNNAAVTKSNNHVVTKENKPQLQKVTRNNTNNTDNKTKYSIETQQMDLDEWLSSVGF